MILRITILIVSLFTIPLYGQSGEAWNAYLAGNFDKVEQLLKGAVEDSSLSDAQLARYYLALGCSDAMRNRSTSATTAFERALDLDPAIKLTSSDIPPPVWQLFEPVRNRMPYTKAPPEITDELREQIRGSAVDTVRITDTIYLKRSAVVNSLIFPGWGHLKEGNGKGWMFAGSEAVLIAGWVTSSILTSNARKDYMDSRTAEDISAKYDDYNSYYRLSAGFAAAAVINYVYCQVDFFRSTHPPQFSQSDSFTRLTWSFNL